MGMNVDEEGGLWEWKDWRWEMERISVDMTDLT